MGDPELLKELKNGNDDAFRMVVEKYQKFVLNCSFKFVRNRESAEDITQEVFLEVFESIHTFRGDSQLSTWIYRIAVAKSLNYLKSQKRKKRFANMVSIFDDNNVELGRLATEKRDPHQEMENQDRIKVLTWALDRIPENQRVAFTLSKYKELSYEEISQIMGTGIPSVESLIHRAKTNLKKILTTYYEKHL